MRFNDTSPEAYRSSLPAEKRELLESIRRVILDVHPGIEEGIEHGMLKYEGLGFLGAQKHHVALYIDPEVLDKFRDELPSNCGKSCIRYRSQNQLNVEILEEIVQAKIENPA